MININNRPQSKDEFINQEIDELIIKNKKHNFLNQTQNFKKKGEIKINLSLPTSLKII